VRERALLVGIDRKDVLWPCDESLAELSRLVDTAGADVVAQTVQALDKPNPRTFIGSGKVEQIASMVRELGCDLVVFDDELTPSQQTNLEKDIGADKIIDRTALILDIFALHATSREGRLQVRLAQNEYLLPRLRGMWAHLASNRMGGGVGSRFGEGESQLEVDRRMVRKRISSIRAELAKLESNRDVQRKARIDSGVFKIVLVGYTNAGKSSLLNRLTAADVLAYDKLFATLDSTTRRLVLPEGHSATITDTVGFIQKLPTTLIEAFKSTLDEIRTADLVMKVADAAASQRDAQIEEVDKVLVQIGAAEIPSLTVYNKCDLIDDDGRAALAAHHPQAILISALDGTGLDDLIAAIEQASNHLQELIEVLIPYQDGDLVELAHERCSIISETYDEQGTRIIMRCKPELATRFKAYRCP